MRDDLRIYVSTANRAQLDRLVGDRNTSRKVVWRAKIVLAAAEGLGTMAIMRRTGMSKPTVWRWQARYVAEGGVVARQDPPAGQKAAERRDQGQGGDQNSQRDAHERDTLDRAVDGQGNGHQPHERAADLARVWPQTASDAEIQAFEWR
jgi:hypothetical protein